jgi:translation initiation factor IF-3
VIDDRGGQLGVMNPRDAIALARQRDADLVEIVPGAAPPVCKIINFGKFKKDKIQKKHQHVSLLKELRFHPNTDTHDFDFKTRHARQFLADGHKVKASVVFKGREITYTVKGEQLLARLTEQLADVAKVDQAAKLEGRSMIMIFAPDRKKKLPEVQPKGTADAQIESAQ